MNEENPRPYPFFMKSAAELAVRLERLGDTDALVMAGEARDLVNQFLSWRLERAPETERFPLIDQLLGLNRRALDHLANREPESVPPESGVRSSSHDFEPLGECAAARRAV